MTDTTITLIENMSETFNIDIKAATEIYKAWMMQWMNKNEDNKKEMRETIDQLNKIIYAK